MFYLQTLSLVQHSQTHNQQEANTTPQLGCVFYLQTLSLVQHSQTHTQPTRSSILYTRLCVLSTDFKLSPTQPVTHNQREANITPQLGCVFYLQTLSLVQHSQTHTQPTRSKYYTSTRLCVLSTDIKLSPTQPDSHNQQEANITPLLGCVLSTDFKLIPTQPDSNNQQEANITPQLGCVFYLQTLSLVQHSQTHTTNKKQILHLNSVVCSIYRL